MVRQISSDISIYCCVGCNSSCLSTVAMLIKEGYGVESGSEDILRGFPSQASEIMGHRKFPPPVPKRLLVDSGYRINLCR